MGCTHFNEFEGNWRIMPCCLLRDTQSYIFSNYSFLGLELPIGAICCEMFEASTSKTTVSYLTEMRHLLWYSSSYFILIYSFLLLEFYIRDLLTRWRIQIKIIVFCIKFKTLNKISWKLRHIRLFRWISWFEMHWK